MDEKVDPALNKEIVYARKERENQEAFKNSVQATFEETLLSTMESTFSKMIDSMYIEELKKLIKWSLIYS